MLKIRDAQLRHLAATHEGRLRGEIDRHLRRWFPHQCDSLGPAALAERIRWASRYARQLGLRTERTLFKYATLALLYGVPVGGSEETGWMNEYLEDPQVPDPHQRLERLYSRLAAEERHALGNARAREEFEHAAR